MVPSWRSLWELDFRTRLYRDFRNRKVEKMGCSNSGPCPWKYGENLRFELPLGSRKFEKKSENCGDPQPRLRAKSLSFRSQVRFADLLPSNFGSFRSAGPGSATCFAAVSLILFRMILPSSVFRPSLLVYGSFPSLMPHSPPSLHPPYGCLPQYPLQSSL